MGHTCSSARLRYFLLCLVASCNIALSCPTGLCKQRLGHEQQHATCTAQRTPAWLDRTCGCAPNDGEQHTKPVGKPGAAAASLPLSQHIVRFNSYKPAADWRSLLTRVLGPLGRGSYRWVERRNKAAAFPTDFALLEVQDGVMGSLQALLGACTDVKDMHPDRRVTRDMLMAKKDGGGVDAGAKGQQQQQQEWQRQQGDGLWEAGSHSWAEGGGVFKRPGRFTTRPTFGLDDLDDDSVDDGPPHVLGAAAAGNLSADGARRRSLQSAGSTVTSLFGADQLWAAGYSGQGVRMGVFDTGIRQDHPHVKNIRERTNWTHEPTLDDGLGHGSFVAGVVAGRDDACPGFAPDVLLHTFRVFTNDQVSYTSWFLDAFNYAIATRMHIINLSIGGPDYLDAPFVDKVCEITSSGIIMVSAIGNDGPLYGTLNNPADQNDVIGVGGIDFHDAIAPFSSRGMSTWELPYGYGRAKPDIMAYGHNVMGSRIKGGCRPLSGTSVASPVVAGAVCLLASVVPEERRWKILNPASMKQAVVGGATRVPDLNIYEQGQGKLNLLNSRDILLNYEPHASVVPPTFDFTDCPYMWPHCRTGVYAHSAPLIFNATVLNGMGLVGYFDADPTFTPTNDAGKHLHVTIARSDLLWPWSGYLAVYIRVHPEAETYEGRATGRIDFRVWSPPPPGEVGRRVSDVSVNVTVDIIPTPPRNKRVLWDQYHNIKYPPGYIPRDNLNVRNDILDWHGDHLHTNYHETFDAMRDAGYYVEVLGSPFTCFDASQYGALLLVDLEEEYYAEEIAKLAEDVKVHGLGLLVFGEWYNTDSMSKMGFYDDNTRSWWTPATGGANIPALNDLLAPHGVALGSTILEGTVALGGDKVYYASGVDIARFPKGGRLLSALLYDRTNADYTVLKQTQAYFPVMGTLASGSGRLGVYGDSNCLDSSHQRNDCHALLLAMLRWAADGEQLEMLGDDTLLSEPLTGGGSSNGNGDAAVPPPLPTRRPDFNFSAVSHVLTQPLACFANSPAWRPGQAPLPLMPEHPGPRLLDRQAAWRKVAGDPGRAADPRPPTEDAVPRQEEQQQEGGDSGSEGKGEADPTAGGSGGPKTNKSRPNNSKRQRQQGKHRAKHAPQPSTPQSASGAGGGAEEGGAAAAAGDGGSGKGGSNGQRGGGGGGGGGPSSGSSSGEGMLTLSEPLAWTEHHQEAERSSVQAVHLVTFYLVLVIAGVLLVSYISRRYRRQSLGKGPTGPSSSSGRAKHSPGSSPHNSV